MNLKLFILLFPIAFVLNKTVSILLAVLLLFSELIFKPASSDSSSYIFTNNIFNEYYGWLLAHGRAGSDIYAQRVHHHMLATYIIICSAYI